MSRSPSEPLPQSPSFAWFADVPVETEPDLMAEQKPVLVMPDWANLTADERQKVVSQMRADGFTVDQPGQVINAAPAASPSKTERPKFPPPKDYDGSPDTFEDFTTKTGIYLRQSGHDATTTHSAYVASMYLTGVAGSWFTNEFQRIELGTAPEFRDYADFCLRLKRAVLPVARTRQAIDEFTSIRQGKTDIRQYTNRFLALQLRLVDQYPETFLCHTYLKGLRGDLTSLVSALNPTTLEEMIACAIHLADRPHAHPPSGSRQGQAKPQTPSLPSSVRKCTHCGAEGHTVDRCWELHPELKRKKKERKAT
jgi:hypothetical protein